MKVPYITKNELMDILKKNGVKIDDSLKKAFILCIKTHKDARRDDGGPYLEQHIYPVVLDVIRYYNSEIPGKKIPQEIIIGALLHDTLEDDREITGKRFKKIFDRKIWEIVRPLTKPRHREDISEKELFLINKKFFEKIIKSNEYSIIIKLADRVNNMEAFYGFSTLDFPKYERYKKEVEKEYLPYTKKHNKYFYKRLTAVMKGLKKK